LVAQVGSHVESSQILVGLGEGRVISSTIVQTYEDNVWILDCQVVVHEAINFSKVTIIFELTTPETQLHTDIKHHPSVSQYK
jgi:hypothetical protein